MWKRDAGNMIDCGPYIIDAILKQFELNVEKQIPSSNPFFLDVCLIVFFGC